MLLQQTLFDAVVTAPMEAYWTALMLNSSGWLSTKLHTILTIIEVFFFFLHKCSLLALQIASFLSSIDEEVETAFLGTRSGLMRFQRYTGIEKRIAKYVDNLKKCFFTIVLYFIKVVRSF